MSSVLKKMNKILNSVFLFQAIICVSFAAASVDWQSNNAKNHSYLQLVK